MALEGEAQVAGTFETEASASAAVAALLAAGFDPERDITVVATQRAPAPGTGAREDVEIPYTIAWMSASNLGAAIGTVLGAAVALVIATGLVEAPPGLFLYGPVVATVEGALLGAGTGWLTGLIAGLGAWKQEAKFDPARGHTDAVRVAVHASGARATYAAEVLQKAGGRQVAA